MAKGIPSTQGKDSRPPIRSLEELMAAPAVDTPDGLLSEAGAIRRELGRRLMVPLPELTDELLRDGGA